jgi:hypothetical protein
VAAFSVWTLLCTPVCRSIGWLRTGGGLGNKKIKQSIYIYFLGCPNLSNSAATIMDSGIANDWLSGAGQHISCVRFSWGSLQEIFDFFARHCWDGWNMSYGVWWIVVGGINRPLGIVFCAVEATDARVKDAAAAFHWRMECLCAKNNLLGVSYVVVTCNIFNLVV